MHALIDHDFIWATGIGALGLLAWLLTTWRDPADDRLGGTLLKAFRDHSLSTFLAFLTYVGACVLLHEMGQLTIAGAFTTGYMGQSLTERIFRARAARLNGGNGGTA